MSRIYDTGRANPSKGHGDVIKDQLEKWQHHREERIAKVTDFTTKNSTLRKSSSNFYEQAAKEFVIWAALKWVGPEGGASWMYGYNAESVLGALV